MRVGDIKNFKVETMPVPIEPEPSKDIAFAKGFNEGVKTQINKELCIDRAKLVKLLMDKEYFIEDGKVGAPKWVTWQGGAEYLANAIATALPEILRVKEKTTHPTKE